MAAAYQGKRYLLEELRSSQPSGGLKAFPPFVYMVTRPDRPTTWHVQAVPPPRNWPPPRVTIEELI